MWLWRSAFPHLAGSSWGLFPSIGFTLGCCCLLVDVDDVEGADDDVQRGIGPDRGGINAGVVELYASQLQLRQN